MDIIGYLLGDKQLSRRVVGVSVMATLVASLPIVLRVDTIIPSLRWYLWGGLIVLGLGLAGYAGRNDGGLLAGWVAVFLAGMWLYVVPPLVVYLQNSNPGNREYDTLRPSVVGLSPYNELVTGLKFGPIVALLITLTAGSTAFLLGKGLQRVSTSSSERR